MIIEDGKKKAIAAEDNHKLYLINDTDETINLSELLEENAKLKAENEELNRQNRVNGNAIKELRRALANIKELAIGFHLIDSEEAYKAMYLGKECYAAFFEDWILIESLKLNKFMLEINGTKEEGGFIIYVGELSDYLFREKEQSSDE